MSSQWKDSTGRKLGSTRYWRKLRQSIVMEHGHRCHLCHGNIDPRYKSPHPLSLEIHHTMGSLAGPYDRRYLRPAHRGCNAAVGNPHPVLPNGVPYDPAGRSLDNWGDPEPRPITKW